MKSLIILILLLIPAISFSQNCMDVQKSVTYSIQNSGEDKALISYDSQCTINFLSIDIYNRWGEKVFTEKIYTNADIPKLNEKITGLKTNKTFKSATYFFVLKYYKEGITEAITHNGSITLEKEEN